MTQTVSILMALHNGAEFLPEQLNSLVRQSHDEWSLLCSDDGSVDKTLDIVSAFQHRAAQPVCIRTGPKSGFAQNFLSLVGTISDDTGPVMFADQDDIWFENKISRALRAVNRHPLDIPVLYGSATKIWNAKTDAQVDSLHQRHAPDFANALVENFASGNTFCLNRAAALLLRDASQKTGDVFAHDWWAYALISGVGGRVIYDDTPTLLYRQHSGNQIGAGETFLKRQLRNLSVADGRYRAKIGRNVSALQSVREQLTQENGAALEKFETARTSKNPISRLVGVMSSGAKRQSKRDHFGMLVAAMLGKV